MLDVSSTADEDEASELGGMGNGDGAGAGLFDRVSGSDGASVSSSGADDGVSVSFLGLSSTGNGVSGSGVSGTGV